MSDYGEIEISSFEVSGRVGEPGACTGEISLASSVSGIGGISVSGACGSHGTAHITGVSVSGTAFASDQGNITFPPFSVLGVVGSTAEIEITGVSVLGQGNPPASGVIDISSFLLEGTAKVGVVCHGEAAITAFSVYGSSYLGVLAQGEIAFKLRVNGVAKIGRKTSGGVTFPPFSVNGSAIVGSPGRGAFEIPPLSVLGSMVDPSEFSFPLAYDKEATQ